MPHFRHQERHLLARVVHASFPRSFFTSASRAPGSPQEKLREIYAERKTMYEQADVTVAQGGEGDGAAMRAEDALVVAERVLAALSKRLKDSDTKQRLRSPPEPGSVSIEGGKGPLRI